MHILITIVISLLVGFLVGVFVEKKNGLVARAEAGETAAIAEVKAKIASAELAVKAKL